MAVCTGSFYSLERMYIDASSGRCCIFTHAHGVWYAGACFYTLDGYARKCDTASRTPISLALVSFSCFAAWIFSFLSNRTMISYSCIFCRPFFTGMIPTFLMDTLFHSCGTLGGAEISTIWATLSRLSSWCTHDDASSRRWSFAIARFESRWWYFFWKWSRWPLLGSTSRMPYTRMW